MNSFLEITTSQINIAKGEGEGVVTVVELRIQRGDIVKKCSFFCVLSMIVGKLFRLDFHKRLSSPLHAYLLTYSSAVVQRIRVCLIITSLVAL